MNSPIYNYSLCLIETTIIFLFLDKLLTSRFKSKSPLIMSLPVFAFLIYFFESSSLFLDFLVLYLVFLVQISLFYKNKTLIKSGYLLTFIYSFYMIDIVLENLFSLFLNQSNIEIFRSADATKLIITLASKIINVLLLYLIYKIFKDVKIDDFYNIWILYNIVIFSFNIINITFVTFYMNSNSTVSDFILYFLISALFFITSLIIIKFFTWCLGFFQSEQKIYKYNSYHSEVENSIALQNQINIKTRKIKHDINKHLESTLSLIKVKDYDMAINLINHALKEVNNININLKSKTGNNLIDGIIMTKLAICEKNEICVNYALESLPLMNIENYDLSALFSNLLDNAIEATKNCQNKNIEIKVFTYRDYLTIIIKNSYQGLLINNSKLNTTKKDVSSHGFGLEIINDVCDKYQGNYSYKTNDDIFSSTVVLKHNLDDDFSGLH